ncbi:hypothetical protein BJF85_09850 [Saccharomonospora sp. CUA-673]|uniref:hypothetical protein n=1 Tax=Saccharomonospora sp. CUA-673 TaxID=1904969 RepID=UPI000969B1FD|nr:hypothetical protein [Saccharomonospora sp. CUA-673]OLT49174.1 hypothetical protein BJF85_09850 [Saccharomonospora sp. CUA-673]
MRMIESFRTVLRANWKTYLITNLVVYGTLVTTMILAVYIPGIRDAGLSATEAFLSSPGSSAVLDAYTRGSIVHAAALTFLGNLLFASLATTTLPSLCIPYIGVLTTLGRAVFIGLPTAPTTLPEVVTFLAFAPVLVIEFQAYVLAMLGAIIHGRSTFGYRRRHGLSPADGYLAGVRDTLRLYPAIIAVLLVVAFIEAITSWLAH